MQNAAKCSAAYAPPGLGRWLHRIVSEWSNRTLLTGSGWPATERQQHNHYHLQLLVETITLRSRKVMVYSTGRSGRVIDQPLCPIDVVKVIVRARSVNCSS
jgi:hypothetical protein